MKKFFKNKKSKAFTLIEFIVVITIASIIMTALIIQQGRWNNRLTVNTQAFELAMMIRQAQIYALGVKENPASTGDKFDVRYGVHMSQEAASAPSDRYILFADLNNNNRYDSGEEVEQVYFKGGVRVLRICRTQSNVMNCNTITPAASNDHRRLDIMFKRPVPDANIVYRNQFGDVLTTQPNKPAYIRVGTLSPSNFVYIKLESNGQISIQ